MRQWRGSTFVGEVFAGQEGRHGWEPAPYPSADREHDHGQAGLFLRSFDQTINDGLENWMELFETRCKYLFLIVWPRDSYVYDDVVTLWDIWYTRSQLQWKLLETKPVAKERRGLSEQLDSDLLKQMTNLEVSIPNSEFFGEGSPGSVLNHTIMYRFWHKNQNTSQINLWRYMSYEIRTWCSFFGYNHNWLATCLILFETPGNETYQDPMW